MYLIQFNLISKVKKQKIKLKFNKIGKKMSFNHHQRRPILLQLELKVASIQLCIIYYHCHVLLVVYRWLYLNDVMHLLDFLEIIEFYQLLHVTNQVTD